MRGEREVSLVGGIRAGFLEGRGDKLFADEVEEILGISFGVEFRGLEIFVVSGSYGIFISFDL